ncbi:MAG: cryptochrome/photolyase family protein [Parachlamydiaceae bacterium]|nr:cryptochrome/photolyase family protein [Parachlamydiaceae bacterium]
MTEITLIFPHQMFEKHPALSLQRPVILVEDYLFFRVQNFHKQKMVLMRASMRFYASYLTDQGYEVIYVESTQLIERESLWKFLSKKNYQKIHFAEVVDDWLMQDIQAAAKKHKWALNSYVTPGFLYTKQEVEVFFEKHALSMASFYAHQRKKYFILMDTSGKPLGGKFSFDIENRKKIPKNLSIPTAYKAAQTPEVLEAIKYINKHFPDAIGNISDFSYPTTFEQAKEALTDFIKQRFNLFGDYEDAICKNESILFHSALSPAINLGLITPQEVIQKVLTFSHKISVPLNSLEGFIRQVMGWREYVKGTYQLFGRTLRSENRFEHYRPLPQGFYAGTTGILPVDETIKKVMQFGYCHHIERLMILGNYLLLMETDPNVVYTWFMECFVDAYDWVMVPNVYAMSQFSSFKEITTKPYISGSNYILKMSNYAKGPWVEIWDGLFWRFFEKHLSLFRTNPRMNMLESYLKKNEEKLRPKIIQANEWVEKRGATH